VPQLRKKGQRSGRVQNVIRLIIFLENLRAASLVVIIKSIYHFNCLIFFVLVAQYLPKSLHVFKLMEAPTKPESLSKPAQMTKNGHECPWMIF
jgi:hypothetical protein